MSDKEKSIFFKSESSSSLTGYGNYSGIGYRYSGKNLGTFDVMLALKATNSSVGGFPEVRYTSPKLGESDLAIESKTRVLLEKDYEGPLSVNLTEQLATKASWDIGKGFGIYQTTGANIKISMQGDGLQSIGPVSITGLNYNPTKKVNLYGELFLSKPYDIKTNTWSKDGSPFSFSFGMKVNL